MRRRAPGLCLFFPSLSVFTTMPSEEPTRVAGRPAVFTGLGWLCRCIDSLILLSIFVAFEFDRSMQKCASSFHSLAPSYAGTGAICGRIIGNGATSPVLLFRYQRLPYQKSRNMSAEQESQEDLLAGAWSTSNFDNKPKPSFAAIPVDHGPVCIFSL